MNFVDAVKSGFSRYFDFSTRSLRSEYWWFFLSYVVAGIVLTIVDGFTIGMGVLPLLAMLAYFIPILAVTARRLHDVGRSGWWILIAFVPIVGGLILLYWMVISGEDDENRFGANPLGAAATAAA